MILSDQIKVLFYAFIYGMFLMSTLKLYKKIKFKKYVFKVLSEFLFCVFNVCCFYYLLYKINNGVLSIYIFVMLFLGVIFCKVLYFRE